MTPRADLSPARTRFALAVIVGLALFTAMDASVAGILMEPIKLEFGISDVQIGLAYLTAFQLANGLAAAPLGMLADRVNRVRLLVAAAVLWSLAMALTGVAKDVYVLAASKVVLGCASAVTFPAALSLVSDYFKPEQRAFATTTFALGQILGGIAGFLVGGYGYAALESLVRDNAHALLGFSPWRVTFLAFAAAGALLAPLVALLREPPRTEVHRASGGRVGELRTYARVLSPLFLGMLFLSAASLGVSPWAAPALMRLYGQGPEQFAGWIAVVSLGGGVGGMLLGAKLANAALKRGGPGGVNRPAAIAALLCVPGSLMAIMPNVFGFAAAMGLFTISASVASAIALISIGIQVPNQLRGLTMGLFTVGSAIAGAAAGPLVGLVSEHIGGGMAIGQAMALVAAPCTLLAAFFLWNAARPAKLRQPAFQ